MSTKGVWIFVRGGGGGGDGGIKLQNSKRYYKTGKITSMTMCARYVYTCS